MPETALRTGERKILAALAELHYATNRQLARYWYAEASYEYVCRLTASLVKRGLLTQDFERRKMAMGKSKSIFFLSAKGHRELAAHGHRIPQMQAVKELQQAHLLGIGDLLLTVRDYTHWQKRAELVNLRHDVITKRSPIKLTIEGRSRAYVPDLWVELAVNGSPWNITFEYDRDTEEEPRWRDKVRRLLAFAASGAPTYFGVKSVTIAVVVAPERAQAAQRRADELVRWTEKELTIQRKEAWGQLFLFAPIDPALVGGNWFFDAPLWRSPFDTAMHPLIEQ